MKINNLLKTPPDDVEIITVKWSAHDGFVFSVLSLEWDSIDGALFGLYVSKDWFCVDLLFKFIKIWER